MGWTGDILSLFYPPLCAACGAALGQGERVMCTACRMDVPLTRFEGTEDNPVARKFWGLIPVVQASSLFFYAGDSPYLPLVLDFKYRGSWRLAVDMGGWLGEALAESGMYGDVDLIVPVPLHPLKKLRRGYNQSEYLARGAARRMGITVDARCVARTVNNPSQTRKDKEQRWENAEGIFRVRKPERLKGKHILLMDDVLTTGATIVSLGEAILRAVPDCTISVATLAVSQASLKR